MDDRTAIEETVRAYIERDDMALLTGIMLRAARIAAANRRWRFSGRTYRIERLHVADVDGDTATVDLEATLNETFERRGGAKTTAAFHVTAAELRREDGAWKLADMRQNGRWLREAYSFRPSGVQEVDRVRLTARLVYGDSTRTAIVFEATNGRPIPVRFGTATIGWRARGRWRWTPAGVDPHELEPGGTTAVSVGGGAIPAGTTTVRVVVPERKRRGGFDLLVELDQRPDALAQPQPAPTRLPVRALIARTGVTHVAALVLASAFLVWLGDLRTAGLLLLAFGGYGLVHNVRSFRGSLRSVSRWLAYSGAMALAGAALVSVETVLSACTDGAAARAADAFMAAAAAGDDRKAGEWLSEDASVLRPLGAMRGSAATRLAGSSVGDAHCDVLWLAAGSRPPHRRCFAYGDEGGYPSAMVLVGRANCRWRVYATI